MTTATVFGQPAAATRSDAPVAVLAAVGIVALALFCSYVVDTRQGVLALVGAAFGFVMYQASFSFAGGWRAAVMQGRTASIRAQMLAIGLACVGVMPILDAGSIGGQAMMGAFGPIGISLFVGSFTFGFGMQLGGGCASGTLFTVGGGSTRMLITLAAFVTGALIGTAHLPWWTSLWNIGVVETVDYLGLWPSIAMQLLGLALVYALASSWEKKKRGRLERIAKPPVGSPALPVGQRLFRGQWPLLWASLLLAMLSIANLLLSGQPWSVTFGFNLWGAKIAGILGLDVSGWTYWQWSMPAQALAGPVLAETTSVTNIGLVLGALFAACLAGKFAPVWNVPLRSAMAAIIGGLLMGYGARLAFGCNIGALFSGIASGSLHGWVWFALAFLGSLAGIRVRPWFGLER
jgi:uncharacterized membrane protein YedE/YeeE